MQRPLTGSIEFQLRESPDFRGNWLSTGGGGRPVLYILLMMPGIFVSLLAIGAYPPVNTRLAMGIMLCVFLLPAVLLMASILLRKGPEASAGTWKWIFVVSSLSLVLFGMLLYLNGNLDNSPPRAMRATVVRKAVVRGRRATQYSLTISSWQPGRSVEYFNVNSDVYNRAFIGKLVTVELHNGRFDFPWHGDISPE